MENGQWSMPASGLEIDDSEITEKKERKEKKNSHSKWVITLKKLEKDKGS